MEDANVAILDFEEDKDASFFGVYDGHGGIIERPLRTCLFCVL